MRAVFPFAVIFAFVWGLLGRAFAQTNFGALGVMDAYGGTATTVSPYAPSQATLFLSGALTVSNSVLAFVAGQAGTITDLRAWLATGPTGSGVTLDVMKNGATIFTTQANRPFIGAGGQASSANLPDVTAFAKGDALSVNVVAIGSTTPGAGLAVSITFKTQTVA